MVIREPSEVRIRFLNTIVCAWIATVATADARDEAVRIYVIGHGWHTGLVIPMAGVVVEQCPVLQIFDGWPFVEIGWGDEGFYRGGTSISLEVAWRAVATPTPTVLHTVGVGAPVERFFSMSEIISVDLNSDQFADLCKFVGATFKLKDGTPIDLGEGIYGHSRFFRAHGTYYFPNTCNVWTLKAVKAAGLPVFAPAGIRTENVIAQAAKHGETIRRFPGRSRLSVLIAAAVAILVVFRFRKRKRIALCAWGVLLLAAISLAAVTMANVNQIAIPKFLPSAAAWLIWAGIAGVAAAHIIVLRRNFRWLHLFGASLAVLAMLVGVSPL